MNIYEILSKIPQRYPFIMVDKVLNLEPGKRIVAQKNVSCNEPYFQGHFPGHPVMPGVMILEALAQASVLLSSSSPESSRENCVHFLAGIDNARFKQVVVPGDILVLDVELIKQKQDVWKIYGEARVDNKIVCSADLMSIQKELS